MQKCKNLVNFNIFWRQNEYYIAKIGFDKAKNESSKIICWHPRFRNRGEILVNNWSVHLTDWRRLSNTTRYRSEEHRHRQMVGSCIKQKPALWRRWSKKDRFSAWVTSTRRNTMTKVRDVSIIFVVRHTLSAVPSRGPIGRVPRHYPATATFSLQNCGRRFVQFW